MNKVLLILILVIIAKGIILPCTTAIVSGKATIDGRPLLLKNRDSDELQNKLVSFSEGEFNFIGVVNSSDTKNSQVWSGFNNYGFAIMNSASYNLKGDDTTSLSDLEGFIMKKALAECKTVDDFEKLLNTLGKPLGVEANFGVIDAQGGAAYFEVNNFKYVKFDVNDPTVAPNGYLIRTNYSFSGEENKGFGYIRFNTATEIFRKEYEKNKLSASFLICQVPRCLGHSITQTNLTEELPKSYSSTKYVFFRDFIPRFSSASTVVIQGVKDKESAALTTMWTILGFPLTSVTVPVWISTDGSIPIILTADKTGNAPLSELALKLKSRVFPKQNDASESYLNLAVIMNKEKTGIRQRLSIIENKIIKKTEDQLADWRQNGFNEKEAKSFYNWIDTNLLNDIYQSTKLK